MTYRTTRPAYAMAAALALLCLGFAFYLARFGRGPTGGAAARADAILAFMLPGVFRTVRLAPARARAYGVAAVCALVMLIGGRWYYLLQRDSLRLDTEVQLDAIARLKVLQVAEWRRERLADAVLVRQTPYAARRALDAMGSPGDDATTRGMFTSWLRPLLAKGPYRQALLLDAQLDVQLAYPGRAPEALCPAELQAAEEALQTQDVAMTDLHRQVEGGPVHLCFMVPLVVRREGKRDNVPAAGRAASPNDRCAGVLVLQCDAGDSLFPALQSWPLPSQSAEALLLRREYGAARVLSNLRHRPDAALNLSVPLPLRAAPKTLGAPGRQGIMYGLDYRGVAVQAVLKTIPDSPWLMLAKRDTAEALAGWHLRARLILCLVLGCILLSGGAATVVWQQNEKAYYRALLAAETARRQSDERHLAEKTVLLKEVHHRVKNNLQIVASLLNLQAARTRQPEVVAALQDTRNRVHSMALLHQVLYGSADLARVNIPAYVQELCAHLLRVHGVSEGGVTVQERVLRVGFSLEHAVPCGLIVSELVSNALKHGTVSGRKVCVTVELCRPAEGQFILRVSDDGAGLAPGVTLPSTATLGLQLVANLAGQLGGTLITEQPSSGGAAFAVLFPVPANAIIEEEA